MDQGKKKSILVLILKCERHTLLFFL